MWTYTAHSDLVEVVGALHLERLGDGAARPHRLPEGTATQVPTAFMRLMAATAAGVRIRFTTEADHVEVHAAVHPVEFAPMGPPLAAVLDLVVDGRPAATRSVAGRAAARLDTSTDTFVIHEGASEAIAFDRLGAGLKTLEVWLPHTAVVDLHSITADRPLVPAAPDSRPRWVHHGSSISHCLEATRPTHTWPAIAADVLGYDLLDLGFAGNAMLDPFVARAIRDTEAALITLKLGINLVNADSMLLRTFLPAVHGFLDTIREGHPSTPIVLISPIACPAVEEQPGPTGMDANGQVESWAVGPIPQDALTLHRIRDGLNDIVATRRQGDAHLAYLDGRALLGNEDVRRGLLGDGLHPTEAGYRIIGERFPHALSSLSLELPKSSRKEQSLANHPRRGGSRGRVLSNGLSSDQPSRMRGDCDA